MPLLEKFEANDDLMTLLIAFKRGNYNPVNQTLREVFEWLKTRYQQRFIHGTAEYRRVQAEFQARQAKAEMRKNELKLREEELKYAMKGGKQSAIERAKLRLAKCRSQQEEVLEGPRLRNEMMDKKMQNRSLQTTSDEEVTHGVQNPLDEVVMEEEVSHGVDFPRERFEVQNSRLDDRDIEILEVEDSENEVSENDVIIIED